MRVDAADAVAARLPFAQRHPWWPRLRKGLGFAFMALVLALVAKLASGMDWSGAWRALQQLPAAVLLLGAALAACSHLLYSTLDLIGRQQTQHGLPAPRVMSVAFVSYAFNLNFGALVGGVAFRFRLYSKLGLAADTITHVLALSMLTNWLGYVFLGGVVLLLAPPTLPPGWDVSSAALPWLGAVMFALALTYVGACMFARRREWRIRGHALKLPEGRVALWQLAVSSANWMLIASIVWALLQQRVDYPHVLGALLLAAVAGVITHVPAGLGVLEAVFVAVLSGRVPQAELLAALLAYRALYYLAPLALAIGLFFVVERVRVTPQPDR